MLEERPCLVCREPFSPAKPRKGKDVARTCGRLLCSAITTWGPEEWAGRRRMAEVHLAVLREAQPGQWYQPPDGPARWMLPGWSELDEEAMKRG